MRSPHAPLTSLSLSDPAGSSRPLLAGRAEHTPLASDPHRTTLTRRACLALAGLGAASLLGACAVPAHARPRWIDLRVVDRGTGAVLPQYPHRGELHVPAESGMRYALQVTNRSAERLLVVLSIDGVNIVTGETASYEQSGYVLAPGQQAELTGWRKSWSEVAAFEFSRLGESYAARTGRPFDVGVIGAAVFRERVVAPVQPPTAPPLGRAQPESPRGWGRANPSAAQPGSGSATLSLKRSLGANDARAEAGSSAGAIAGAQANAIPGGSAMSPAPAAAPPGAARSAEAADAATASALGANPERYAAARRDRLGTAHGEREIAYTGQTTFERASREPAQVIAIRYDSRDNLVAMGIIREPRPRPLPFPQQPGEPGFVADPPGAVW